MVNAPQEMVYNAWADPGHLKNWWGPNGFTNTIHEFDFRPGGKWTFTMHGPNNADYPNESVFVALEKPQLIVFDHLSNPQFRIVATFDKAAEDKTNITWRMIFPTAEACAALRAFVTEKNEEIFVRLEEELKKMA